MIDTMVLGQSLQEHGNKAKRVLCINNDTQEMRVADLMKAFWQFLPVEHAEVPQHLQGSEQTRLQGVYSKLQTVRIFADWANRENRVLLCDADMLVRANIDDLFGSKTPAAVMRGDADTCLFQPRPSHTYFPVEQSMAAKILRPECGEASTGA